MKKYLDKFARKVLEIEMPGRIRKEYKTGVPIKVKVERFGKGAWLHGYGDNIEFTIGKNGELIESKFDVQGHTPITWIIDYMLTGSSGSIEITFNGEPQRKGQWEYNHTWNKQETRRSLGKKHYKYINEILLRKW